MLPVMTPKVPDQGRRRAMRTRGFDDGIVGARKPRHPDDRDYMASFRRGREALNRQEDSRADH